MYKYKVVSIRQNETPDVIEKLLNDMGADEWEMCGTQNNGYGATMAIIFKKRI